MSHKSRLAKLEQPVLERWREAWSAYFSGITPHLEALLDPLTAVCKEGARLGVLETTSESRAALDRFAERLGLPIWITSWGWGDEDEIDLDKPDLTRWPESIPDPPPEPLEAWKLVEPFTQSEDVSERFCAYICLFTLGQARGHREYLRRGEEVSDTKA